MSSRLTRKLLINLRCYEITLPPAAKTLLKKGSGLPKLFMSDTLFCFSKAPYRLPAPRACSGRGLGLLLFYVGLLFVDLLYHDGHLGN